MLFSCGQWTVFSIVDPTLKEFTGIQQCSGNVVSGIDTKLTMFSNSVVGFPYECVFVWPLAEFSSFFFFRRDAPTSAPHLVMHHQIGSVPPHAVLTLRNQINIHAERSSLEEYAQEI